MYRKVLMKYVNQSFCGQKQGITASMSVVVSATCRPSFLSIEAFLGFLAFDCYRLPPPGLFAVTVEKDYNALTLIKWVPIVTLLDVSVLFNSWTQEGDKRAHMS